MGLELSICDDGDGNDDVRRLESPFCSLMDNSGGGGEVVVVVVVMFLVHSHTFRYLCQPPSSLLLDR